MNEKAQIIAMLGEVFNHWEELLTHLTEEQITDPNRVANMSIKDIIAHLTVWQQINVARLEAAIQNKEPEYPTWHPGLDPESEEELAKINAWIYEACHERLWSDLYQEWQGRFSHFLKLAETIPEKDLLEVGRYPWLREYPLSAVLIGSHEHHKEHLEPLLALLGQS